MPGSGQIVNTYTSLTADANAGNTTLTVANNALNGGIFGGSLGAGDLIFIIQMKGVSMSGVGVDVGNVDGYAGTDTVSFPADPTLGSITGYNDCGNHEYAEVVSTSGGATITLRCGLQFDYTAAGDVQVIRVPRFTDLTIPGGTSITAPAWDGTVGGAVILEVDGDVDLTGTIDVDDIGFRGGDDAQDAITFGGAYASTMPREGARKGEGIGGFNGTYSFWGGMYGRAAFANAGGGGTAHNSGGGGGANAAALAWNNGMGNPDASVGGWATAWNIEGTSSGNGMSSTFTSGGGGRGGHTLSQSDGDATDPNDPPGDGAAWGGDNRRIQGGLGGRPLNYNLGKIFFGGGGGSGEYNDNEGGDGGNAAGLVYMVVTGDVTGSGSIEANGQDGFDAVGPAPGFAQITGNDAAGGAGAGGTVLLDVAGTIGGIDINADGGNGGNLAITLITPKK